MGIYGLDGWDSYDKVAVSFGKNAGIQGSTLSGHRMTTGVSVSLNSRPMAYYKEGRTTPHLRLVSI